ncbi:pyruvate kinase [Motilimonas sp. E26]|uniref:pyruvate kinase n=1 Tax=Motilimonas sp. E26 TaxID=2865674 RepID=UPI001E5FCD92|nr:pyruvate kinase [Motilimonas sp. E26]MCE0559334.1 pyruvate kinase [Motilimonas sp. E26]
MRKTKIVATLGPASQSRETLTQLIQAGVNVVRLNFSHGSSEEHIARANLVREIAQQLNVHVGVLVDLQGPKIRIAGFKDGPIKLAANDEFTLNGQLDPQQGDQTQVGLDYPQLIQDLAVGDTLLLDDGRVQLQVEAVNKSQQWVKTRVLNSGVLSDRKGINLLGGGLSAPALTEKDQRDILTAAKLQADFLAISFPRNAQDIHHARNLAQQAGCRAHLVAKIERAEVVANQQSMDEVIQASDVIMVARGDLGVEIGDARLSKVQKQLISRAKALAKPVITATQMLESMIDNPLPTRAEVMDIANAVLDGTDAIMLSAESAAGQYPVEAVAAMVRITQGVEADITLSSDCWQNLLHQCDDIGKSFALSTMLCATQVDHKLGIAILTKQGKTPLLMSRCQSQTPIWALSDDPALLRKLAILRGVSPILFAAKENAIAPLSQQVANLLYKNAKSDDISSLLMAQFDSVEAAGNINMCELIALPVTATVAA